ncbi:MAG: DUF2585 family protein [Verrucomicrobiota bacterium]
MAAGPFYTRWTEATWSVVLVLAALLGTAATQAWMGRSPLGPDGRLALWEWNIWSQECSQRLIDPYSFSHILHGILFYAGLWMIARRQLAIHPRFWIALALETGWELLENSPLIIQRYREATLALGYEGDSIVNSLSDILMMVFGFIFAQRAPRWVSLGAVLLMEILCAWWIRDNLTLNIIMLLHPVEGIKAWQLGARPTG